MKGTYQVKPTIGDGTRGVRPLLTCFTVEAVLLPGGIDHREQSTSGGTNRFLIFHSAVALIRTRSLV